MLSFCKAGRPHRLGPSKLTAASDNPQRASRTRRMPRDRRASSLRTKCQLQTKRRRRKRPAWLKQHPMRIERCLQLQVPVSAAMIPSIHIDLATWSPIYKAHTKLQAQTQPCSAPLRPALPETAAIYLRR